MVLLLADQLPELLVLVRNNSTQIFNLFADLCDLLVESCFIRSSHYSLWHLRNDGLQGHIDLLPLLLPIAVLVLVLLGLELLPFDEVHWIVINQCLFGNLLFLLVFLRLLGLIILALWPVHHLLAVRLLEVSVAVFLLVLFGFGWLLLRVRLLSWSVALWMRLTLRSILWFLLFLFFELHGLRSLDLVHHLLGLAVGLLRGLLLLLALLALRDLSSRCLRSSLWLWMIRLIHGLTLSFNYIVFSIIIIDFKIQK